VLTQLILDLNIWIKFLRTYLFRYRRLNMFIVYGDKWNK
jgi:hypothetical protein